MFETPVEKVRKLRKKYNITQEELTANKKIAKITLALIETNKRTLNNSLAEIICENFNEILKMRKIKERVVYKELIKSKEEQAKEFLNNLIKNKSLLELDVTVLDGAIIEIAREEASVYCLELAKLYYEAQKMNLAKYYCEKGLIENPSMKNDEVVKKLLLYLTRSNYYSDDFKQNVVMIEKYMPIIKKENDELSMILTVNYGNSLYKIGNIEKTFEVITTLLNNKKLENKRSIFIAKNILAMIYYIHFGELEKAKNIYNDLMEEAKGIEKIILSVNLLEISILAKDTKEQKMNIKKLLELLKTIEIDDEKIYESHLQIIESLHSMGDYKSSKDHYFKIFELKNKELLPITKKYKTLMHALENIEKFDDDKFILKLEKYYKEFFQEAKNFEPLVYFLSYYSKRKDFNLSEYLTFFKK